MLKQSSSIRAIVAARCATYRRDQSGSLIVFSLFIFVVMLMVGGLAVDLMRFESERKHLQNTLDSAVLAASDLKQTAGSREVVDSFLEQSGFDPDIANVSVETDTLLNGDMIGRTVGAVGLLEMDTILMKLAGVDTLSTNAGGTANESIQNVEISLVLDISGSMRWGLNNSNTSPSRIGQLRDAVEDFIDIVLQVECDASGLNCTQSPNTASTTINIIPYAGHVNPGPDMFELLGGSRWHSWSSCLEVTDDDFANGNLPSDSRYQLPHFMKWSIESSVMNWGWCPTDDAAIIVAENDAETLKTFVRNVRMHDGTATHVGAKYGYALLNPSSRGVFQELRNRGVVANAYANRPAQFNDEVVKYLVLMTDGQTTDQFRPNDFDYEDFYTGWDEFTASFDGTDYTGGGDEDYVMSPYLEDMLDRYGSFDSDLDVNSASDVEYGYKAGDKLKIEGVTHTRDRNRDNLQKVCDEARVPVMGTDADGNSVQIRSNRVTVFTIAFLAPSNARKDMRDCASTGNNFFDVRDLEVGEAFTSIARTINQLRLTN
jgi:Flp pilus assembly protein TadG